MTEENEKWLVETMLEINRLTPDVKGKAFSPDWFELRQRFEAKLEELDLANARITELSLEA